MRLTKRELIDLPVYTKSSQHLGKVVDFELDTNTQMIIQFHVKSADLITGLLGKELLINFQQVISITDQKMIVEDGVVKERGALRKAVPAS